MKTSEMIAMLMVNPNLKFKRKEWTDYNSIGIKNGKLQMIQQNGCEWKYSGEYSKSSEYDKFVEVCEQIGRDGDWQLVREPVTWQEAIQAWIDGKEIEVCECAGCESWHRCLNNKIFYSRDNTSIHGLCRQQFKTAKWYINE